MARPSREEYENAKREYPKYCDWVDMARKRQCDLIDYLSKAREDELIFSEMASKQYEIIVAYQVIEEEKKKREDAE